jgi:hypothetical protein
VFSADEMEGIALRYGAFYGQDSFTRMIINPGVQAPAAGGFVRRRVRQLHLPGGRCRRDRGRPGEGARRTGVQPRRRRAGALGRLPGRARGRTRVRWPWRVPAWMLRAIPYLHTILSTSMRVSNAKARRQLGWAPAVSTYREGIPLVARASR